MIKITSLQLFADQQSVTHEPNVMNHSFAHLPEYGEFGMRLYGWIPVLRDGRSLGDFTTSIPGSKHQPKHGGERGVVQNDANLEAEHTKSLNTNVSQDTKMII